MCYKNHKRGNIMTNQQSLFNVPPYPAPESAVIRAGKRGRIKALVLHFLSKAPGGLTDEELTDHIHALDINCRHTSVVSARNSLCEELTTGCCTVVEPRFVEDSGNRRLSPTSGFRVTVWRAK